jgi:hypothetical protein
LNFRSISSLQRPMLRFDPTVSGVGCMVDTKLTSTDVPAGNWPMIDEDLAPGDDRNTK